MLNIVIFGAPGSGKGTQSDMLKRHYELEHISTGEVLRAEIKSGTELGVIAKEYIDKGELVPDDLICDMLEVRLKELGSVKGVIFDGFPRTVAQAEALEAMLARSGEQVSLLLDLQVEDAELVTRLLERGKISGRSDDNEQTIRSRLNVYHTQTAPLAEFYRLKGKHVAINGTGKIEEIFKRIREAIEVKSKK